MLFIVLWENYYYHIIGVTMTTSCYFNIMYQYTLVHDKRDRSCYTHLLIQQIIVLLCILLFKFHQTLRVFFNENTKLRNNLLTFHYMSRHLQTKSLVINKMRRPQQPYNQITLFLIQLRSLEKMLATLKYQNYIFKEYNLEERERRKQNGSNILMRVLYMSSFSHLKVRDVVIKLKT